MNRGIMRLLRSTARKRYQGRLLKFLALGCVVLICRAQSTGRQPVTRQSLCVTEGEIFETSQKELSVAVPKMRAWEMAWPATDPKVRFTYLGPTEKELPLGSGEIRRQFGLKLRAQDACNLVYVMWRFEPESKVVVSVKSNPGQHTSAECGNRGYRNVKPSRSAAVPAVKVGSTHILLATEERGEIKVFADGALVWEGFLGAEALNLFGPPGIRSDNAHVIFSMSIYVPDVRYNNPIYLPPCKREQSESVEPAWKTRRDTRILIPPLPRESGP